MSISSLNLLSPRFSSITPPVKRIVVSDGRHVQMAEDRSANKTTVSLSPQHAISDVFHNGFKQTQRPYRYAIDFSKLMENQITVRLTHSPDRLPDKTIFIEFEGLRAYVLQTEAMLQAAIEQAIDHIPESLSRQGRDSLLEQLNHFDIRHLTRQIVGRTIQQAIGYQTTVLSNQPSQWNNISGRRTFLSGNEPNRLGNISPGLTVGKYVIQPPEPKEEKHANAQDTKPIEKSPIEIDSSEQLDLSINWQLEVQREQNDSGFDSGLVEYSLRPFNTSAPAQGAFKSHRPA